MDKLPSLFISSSCPEPESKERLAPQATNRFFKTVFSSTKFLEFLVPRKRISLLSKVNFIQKFASNSALINCGTIKSPFYICYYNAFIRSRQR
ncbi:hypothetical protein [Lactococcus garvieae]|uniref:hypothetical protein n=1 Tax=Lactococcus garvieae TaxID=1363 RepID=UPI00388ED530